MWRQMDRWKQCRTRRSHQAKCGQLVGDGRLHCLENLNNINVNGWANHEIIQIIREQNAEIDWRLYSRKSHIQLPMLSKFHATVD
jgi:transcription initiation factor TFIID subunit TAF12